MKLSELHGGHIGQRVCVETEDWAVVGQLQGLDYWTLKVDYEGVTETIPCVTLTVAEWMGDFVTDDEETAVTLL